MSMDSSPPALPTEHHLPFLASAISMGAIASEAEDASEEPLSKRQSSANPGMTLMPLQQPNDSSRHSSAETFLQIHVDHGTAAILTAPWNEGC